MTEYWQRSEISGHKSGENAYSVAQTILHRRGEDPVRMACRRDGRMAACDRITVETTEAFQTERYGLPVHRDRREIPKEEKPTWTYDSIPD
jgi:hypothetical protein